MLRTAAALVLAALAQPALAQPAPDTIAAIRARGSLLCAVTDGAVGFGSPDARGVWHGLDVDFCRAVAAAVLGDATKVRFVPASTQQRFTMLQSGEVDLLARATTWTLSREASLGIAFAGINFYDGQGFMVRRSLGVTEARQLDGATLCIQPGTTSELNATDFFRRHGIAFTPVLIESMDAVHAAFVAGRCDVYTNDTSGLASFRAGQGERGADFVVLPDLISKEPLGPAVRKGDWKFFDAVRWTHFAMLTAEELGVGSADLARAQADPSPEMQRLTGRTGDLGRMLGLSPDWAVQVIRQVGNFAEAWDRNMAPLGVPRGLNALWNRGGLHYAPPMR